MNNMAIFLVNELILEMAEVERRRHDQVATLASFVRSKLQRIVEEMKE